MLLIIIHVVSHCCRCLTEVNLVVWLSSVQVREYMAKMGFCKLNEMIGRCDLLEAADPLNEKVKV